MNKKEAYLQYPNKSHRKVIKYPNNNEKLAELLGIIAGDGGIDASGWQVVISLNSNLDRNYSKYVAKLFDDLFGVKASVIKRNNENTLRVVCSSTNVVDYLLRKGVVMGNKIKNNISMPAWVRGCLKYRKAFVRGLFDTDGCLYVHKHHISHKTYFNLEFCFTSYASGLIESVGEVLNKFGIEPHFKNRRQRIYLYSYVMISKFLKCIGSSNDRILDVYSEWLKIKDKKHGLNGEVA